MNLLPGNCGTPQSELKKENMGPEATERLFQLRLKDAADDLDCQAKAYFEAAAEIGRGEMQKLSKVFSIT
jgi:hypothetical protein